jgi:hypothetical protein
MLNPLRMIQLLGWVRNIAEFRLIGFFRRLITSLPVHPPEVLSRIMAHQQNKGPKTETYRDDVDTVHERP